MVRTVNSLHSFFAWNLGIIVYPYKYMIYIFMDIFMDIFIYMCVFYAQAEIRHLE